MKFLVKKDEEVVEKNMQAIQQGFDTMAEQLGDRLGEWEIVPADGKHRMFMIGNDAIALGAFSSRCSFYGSISNYTSF